MARLGMGNQVELKIEKAMLNVKREGLTRS
jgi:hypothetical protein